MVRAYLKIFCFIVLLLFYVPSTLLTDLFVRDGRKKVVCLSRIASFFARLLVKMIGVKVDVKNYEKFFRTDKNYFLISNHVSYLDIFIIASLVPSIFTANAELKDDFLLGNVIKLGGSIFVERRNRSKLMEDIETISGLIKQGFNVVLFPEGTTSNGEALLPFKTSFLDLPIKSNAETLLVCIKYKKINGKDITPENRDLIFYYGGMKFFPHFFSLLALNSITAELNFIEAIPASPDLSRKDLSKHAFETISNVYHGTTPSHNFTLLDKVG